MIFFHLRIQYVNKLTNLYLEFMVIKRFLNLNFNMSNLNMVVNNYYTHRSIQLHRIILKELVDIYFQVQGRIRILK
jgi:hypothetical protein